MKTKIFIALIVALLIYGLGTKMIQRVDSNGNPITTDNVINTSNMKQADTVAIVDSVVGSGAEAKVGNTVKMKYTGKLLDGTVFDSTDKSGQPFTFTLGANSVIQGWEQGIPGMKVGGKRTLTIPPSLAYGERASGSIPANSTLIFDVELVEIVK